MDRNSRGRFPAPMAAVVAGMAAAIGASACCVGPLLLVLAGVGGAWTSRLVALEPYQPLFIGATLGFFGLAAWALYRTQPKCVEGEACAAPVTRRRQRFVFWTLAVVSAALMLFPTYAPIFY